MAFKFACICPLVPVLLAGCVREAEVVVTKRGDRVLFTVARGDEPACVRSIYVSLNSERPIDTPPLWETSAADLNTCASAFVYGQAPPGFSRSGPARSLSVGEQYLVEFSGSGLLGGTTFTLPAQAGVIATPS
jgi:hypothetical protein